MKRAALSFGAVLAAGTFALAQDPLLRELHRALPIDAAFSTGVRLGDVDGDGDLDAFLPIKGKDGLYRNVGSGVFEDRSQDVPAAPGVSDTLTAALGDFDGDGDLDALLGEHNQQNRLFSNDGAGVFSDVTPLQLPADIKSESDVAVGDVDGDGDLDVFLVYRKFSSSEQPALLVNDGFGAFALAASQVPVFNNLDSDSVALADVDTDGDLDVGIGNAGLDRLCLNDGAGTFIERTGAFPLDGMFQTSVILFGDVDGDGRIDCVKEGVTYGTISLFTGDGTGLFGAQPGAIPDLDFRPVDAVLEDLDGDGELDLLVANHVGPLQLFLGTATAAFVDASNLARSPTQQAQGLAVGDVDGDGDLDAFVANWLEQNRLFLGDGSGGVVEPSTNLPGEELSDEGVALGDVDGDGDLDAIFATGGQDRLYLNDQAGFFTEVAGALPVGSTLSTDVELGDVDGDGDLDALVANGIPPVGGGGANSLYRNELDTLGVFTDASAALPFFEDHSSAVALGDLDGDGDLDAIVANIGTFTGGPQANRLYRNVGGSFVDGSAQLPAHIDRSADVTLADLDGDGDLDAVLATLNGPNRLYGNDGTGTFFDASALLPSIDDASAGVAVGDVDGDGSADIFVANAIPFPFGGGQQNRLYRNDLLGSGAFLDWTASLPQTPDATLDVELADIDDDGDLDALVSRSGELALLLNDGAGLFVEGNGPPTIGGFLGATDIEVADLDGDGDLDVLTSNSGTQNRFYTNVARHVAADTVAGIGKGLTMRVYGPPLGPWLLGTATAKSALPLPPFGTLYLDLATFALQSSGALAPDGEATFSVAVPAAPALVGATVYWQAAVGPNLRLTNAHATTIGTL